MPPRRPPKTPRVSLRQIRIGRAGVTNKHAAKASGMSAPNVARLERAGSLETVSVATLRRYLRAIGYDLQIVATPLRGAPDDAVDVVDPADADDPTDA